MATTDKDFKVKNGLVVTDGGTFGGSVVVGTPTQNDHAATKLYVDENAGGGSGVTVSDTAPASPSEGDIWFDSSTGRKFVYYDNFWVESGSSGPEGPEGPEPYNVTISTSPPTGGSDGDVWFQY